MGDWYWIGVCAGLGVGIGVLLAGLLTGTRAALTSGLVLAVGAGVGVGFLIGEWDEAIGGGARFGTAVFIAIAAVVLAALAWIPAAGFVEAALVPAFAARLRGRAAERYAGLRSLARD